MQTENFLFFGCWGVYCQDIQFTKPKKDKKDKKDKEDKLKTKKYLGKTAYDTLEKYYQNIKGYDAVIIAGDNVYAHPETGELDIKKQIKEGFENCISNLNSNTFLLGIGNHDIENCDILNIQKEYKGYDRKLWKLQEFYSVKFSHVKFIFINTNIYEYEHCDKTVSKEQFDQLRKEQFDWLKKELYSSDVNIVVGHIPPISCPHKIKGDKTIRIEKNLLDDLLELSEKIDLYVCADEHNQQLLRYTNDEGKILNIGVSGSGGADLDDLYCPEDFPGLEIKYRNKGVGGIHLKIRKNILLLTFISGKKINGNIELQIEDFQYGDEIKQMNEVYKTVKEYEDLLKTNVDFFKNKLPRTFYYHEPWGEGSDQNDHAIKSTRNLIELNSSYRIFTHNGQSNYHDEYTTQRSFLDFYIEIDKFFELKPYLDTDNRIWYVADVPGVEEILSKFPRKKGKEIEEMVLTYEGDEPFTFVNRMRFKNYRFSKEVEEYPKILQIFNGLVSVSIICKYDTLADEVLLEHMKKIYLVEY